MYGVGFTAGSLAGKGARDGTRGTGARLVLMVSFLLYVPYICDIPTFELLFLTV